MITSLNIKDFVFYNEPIYHSRSVYDRVIADIVRTMSECTDIVSIYQMGEVSAPGISDIDLIFVLKDNPDDIGQFKKKYYRVKRKYNYFFDPKVINEACFDKLHLIFPIFDLIHRYGKPLKPTKPKNDVTISEIILIDFINFYWPREFLRIVLNKKKVFKSLILTILLNDAFCLFGLKMKKGAIDMRNLLCRLNSMKYPLRILTVLTKKKYPALQTKINRILYLRRHWFKLSKNRREHLLLRSLVDINEFCQDLIYRYSKYLESKNIFDISRLDDFSIETQYGIVNYKKNWTKENFFNKSEELFQKRGKIVSLLPLVFAPTMLFFFKRSNLIRDAHFLRVLSERYNLIRQQIDFLNRQNLFEGCFFSFDYAFKGPFLFKVYLKMKRLARLILFASRS